MEKPKAIMGLETEFGLIQEKYDDFITAMAATDKVTAINGNGLWLRNGGLIYIDRGRHPEYATPECSNPKDLVAHIIAGERELQSWKPDVLFKTNYLEGVTWGCHESYMTSMSPRSEKLEVALLPHLATRIIYTGAGGMDSFGNFVLSPRLQGITHTCSGDTTGDRGLYCSKDESLSDTGSYRLHLICGEPLCSQLSMYLKSGTTSLITELACQGIWLNIRLEPMHIARITNLDPTMQRKFAVGSNVEQYNGKFTAREIQYFYLEMVENNLDKLPDWARECCQIWRQTLDDLAEGPEKVKTKLDWAIKYALFERFKTDRGRGLIKDRLVNKLIEIDIKFGILGPSNIFAQLEEAGVLDHKIIADSEIELAMTTPPQDTRAKIRGEFVKELLTNLGIVIEEQHFKTDEISFYWQKIHTTWQRIDSTTVKRFELQLNPTDTTPGKWKLTRTRG